MTTLRPDIVIVGGGLVGCSAALFIRQRGRSVVVIEKGRVGAQASGVNFGNVRLQGRHPKQYPLSLRAQEIWESLEALTGEDCEYRKTGHIYIALGDDQIAKLEQMAGEATAGGVNVEVMGGNEGRRHWPWLGPIVRGVCWSPRDAVANPRLATPAIARTAMAAGADIREQTLATSITRLSSHFRIETDRGVTVEAPILINAAGAWGADIAAQFGEPVPLFPAGPPMLVSEPMPYTIEPSVQSVDGTVIFRQIDRGNIIIGGFPRGPSDPVANRAPVPPRKIVAALARLAEVAPSLRAAHVIRVWSGIEGYLPDMLPVIGKSATTEGLIHAFGLCGHGFQIGPAVGACLAELAIDGRTPTPLEAMAIGRFAGGVTVDDKFKKEFDTAIVAKTAKGAAR
jgi:sarcosine oxidase subunit beta